jgi:hypothetical protein
MVDRKTIAAFGVAVTNAANLAVIAPNERRVGIIFGNPNAITAAWAVRETPVSATAGLPLETMETQELHVERFGSGIQDEIRILGTAAGQNFPFVEFLVSP